MAKERISNFEGKLINILQLEKQKEEKQIASEAYGALSNVST